MSNYSTYLSTDLLGVLRQSLTRDFVPQAERRSNLPGPFSEFPDRHVSPPSLNHPSFPPRHLPSRERRPDFDLVEIRPGHGAHAGSDRHGPRRPFSGFQDRHVSPPSLNHPGFPPRHLSSRERRPDFDLVEIRPGRDAHAGSDRRGPRSDIHQGRTRARRSDYDVDHIRSRFDADEEFNGFQEDEGFETHRGPLEDWEDFAALPEIVNAPPPRRRGGPQVNELIAALPRVAVASLPEGERSCPVCMNDYESGSDRESGIRLICHHVVGKKCLKRWLDDGNSTCPICRTNVYGESGE